jgi:hypothetical protein
MNDVFEIFGVGLMSTLIFSVPFIFFAFWRYLRYKETIALAERGLLRPTRNRNGNGGRDTLRWGIIIASIGMALSCGLWPIGFQSDFPLGLGPWMVVGFLPLFFGIALVVIHYVTRNETHYEVTAEPEGEEPVPPHKQ